MKIIKEQKMTYNVKGTPVTFLEKILIDDHTGEEIFDPKLEQENDVNLYNEYRKTKGLLLPKKIKEIRKKFGVTQTIFAKVLGLGDKTIARYENGSLQDMAQNNLIKAVSERPIYFLELLRDCKKLKEELSDEEFKILLNEVKEKIKLMTHFKLKVKMSDFKIITHKKYNPNDIACFILKKYDYDKMEEMITPLKLQKLLNYVYSYLLTIFGYKIFNENPQAWAHGPVFKSVYDNYSSYGYRCIDIPNEDISLHEKNLEKFILKIAEGYGKFSAKDLEHLTHKEKPWIKSRKRVNAKEGEICTEEILDSDIIAYFKELLEK